MSRRAADIETLGRVARRKVPRVFFDFLEGGAGTEHTLRMNTADLAQIALRPRVLVDVRHRDLSTTILGEAASLPLALAPVGLLGLQRGDGEILACRAAQEAGIPFCLSTMSVCSIEDVAGATDRPFWFQVHLMKDRGFLKSLIERARDAKCSALVLTVDLSTVGQRNRDIRNGMGTPPKLHARTIFDIMTKPAWALGIARTKHRRLGNLVGHIPGVKSSAELYRWLGEQFDTPLSWRDIEWVAGLWPGKLVLKGIADPADAVLAARSGATALVVSNHGGRQLDGAPSTISVLPRIAEAVGGSTEILFDGGIRTGQDIVRALALGAHACLLGRSYAYGLAASGKSGVSEAIEILRRELDTAMALTGRTTVRAIDRDVIFDPARHLSASTSPPR